MKIKLTRTTTNSNETRTRLQYWGGRMNWSQYRRFMAYVKGHPGLYEVNGNSVRRLGDVD